MMLLRVLYDFLHRLDWIVGRTNHRRGWARTIKVDQAIYRSTFLVNCHHQGNRRPIAVHLPNQTFELSPILDIVIHTEKECRTYIVLADHRTDIRPILRSNELDDHHLAEFLIERHILHKRVDILLGSEVWHCPCRCTRCQFSVKLISDILEEIGITFTAGGTQYKYPNPSSFKLCSNPLPRVFKTNDRKHKHAQLTPSRP